MSDTFVSKELLEGLTSDQKKVLSLKSGNILVNAGAGSGKTTVLTKRVIHLLKDEHYSLKEIIVLTFTNLAAKEMKDRIISALEKESDENLKEELAHIDEASIMTFDAFCNKFVKKYSAYSILPLNFNIGDEALFLMKKNEFLDLILEKYYKNDALIDYIKLFGFPNHESLKKNLIKYFNELSYEIDPLDVLDNYEKRYVSVDNYNLAYDKLEEIVRFKINKLNDIEFYSAGGKSELLIKILEDERDKLNDITNSLEDIYKIVNTPFPNGNSYKADPNDSDKDLYKSSKNDYKNIRTEIKELLSIFELGIDLKDAWKTSLYFELVIRDILRELFIKMNEFKTEHAIYSFSDIDLEALRILKENKEISDYYKNTIKEILIDEYQDTSDINSLLVSYISNNNEVVVGDVKQSIYRFRNANPSIFSNRYTEYQKLSTGTIVDLKENFRSRSEVINLVNNIFPALGKDISLESDFFNIKMEYGNKVYDKFPIESDLYRVLGYNPKNIDYKESDYIAQDIKNRMEENLLVYDHNTKENRPARFSDFMILSRSRDHFRELQESLEKCGIPSRIMDTVKFSSSEEVIFLKNALKLVYLINTNQTENQEFDFALLSILRSFVIKVSDDLIARYMIKDKTKTNMDRFEACFKELYLLFIELNDIYNNTGVTNLLDSIIKKFSLFEKIMSLNDIEQREAKINILITNISTYSKSGMDLDDIVKYFSYLKKNDIDLEASLNSFDDLDCVNIMTIHKSKGLEKPHVYLAYLNSFKDYPPSYTKDFGFNLYAKDSIKSLVQNLENKKEDHKEYIRLLYVAVTRARESITLVMKDIEKEERKDIYSFKQFYQFFLYSKTFNINNKIYIVPENISSEYEEYEPEIVEPLEYKELNLKDKTLVSKTHASSEALEVDKELIEALERGTNLHSFFEITDFIGDIEEEIRLKNIPGYFAKYLRKFKDQDIFKGKLIRELHEHPYYLDDENGIIDYCLEKENEFLIIDFKTKNIDNPHYLSQLKAYKSYIMTRTDKKIRTYLYSILNNELKEIEI